MIRMMWLMLFVAVVSVGCTPNADDDQQSVPVQLIDETAYEGDAKEIAQLINKFVTYVNNKEFERILSEVASSRNAFSFDTTDQLPKNRHFRYVAVKSVELQPADKIFHGQDAVYLAVVELIKEVNEQIIPKQTDGEQIFSSDNFIIVKENEAFKLFGQWH